MYVVYCRSCYPGYLFSYQTPTIRLYKSVYEGWMQKKGERRRNWKKRYFILLPSTELLYYVTENTDDKAKGSIMLSEALGISSENHRKSPKITENHRKSSRIIENHPKSSKIIQNHPKSSKIIENHPKSSN